MAATGSQNVNLVTAAKPMSAAGAIFVAPLGTKLPTETKGEFDAKFASLGYISEDGITNAIEKDSETIVAFGGETVLVTSSSKTETFAFKAIEANAAVAKFIFGEHNVVGDDTEGFTVKHTAEDPEPVAMIIALMLNRNRRRIYCCPNAQISEIGENVLVSNDVQGFELTVTATPDENGVSVYEYTDPLPKGDV